LFLFIVMTLTFLPEITTFVSMGKFDKYCLGQLMEDLQVYV